MSNVVGPNGTIVRIVSPAGATIRSRGRKPPVSLVCDRTASTGRRRRYGFVDAGSGKDFIPGVVSHHGFIFACYYAGRTAVVRRAFGGHSVWEHRFYAPGLGQVLTVNVETGDRVELVEITRE